ncbi:asparagine synthase (glutamine-hydrolyzing) [Patescibacteria group bacterium]
MCGIIGFSGKQNIKTLQQMLNKIKHRGPDDKALYFGSNINAGMVRLSIIDLRLNLYPMKYKNLVLLYNGEIYNYKQLKKILIKKNVKFKTNSDAEVILPLFNLYGPKSFSMLDGMFAIFIYDKKNKKIYLVRDKVGEKPLYFFHKSGFLAFSSELKALLIHSKIEKVLNSPSLASYLYQGHVFAPNTIIKGICKIPSGSYLEFNQKNFKTKLSTYWRLSKNQKVKSTKNILNLAKKLDDLILSSVKSRLLSDVPIGSFLSGGIDSSLITYFASNYIKNLKTFSISFPKFAKYDETKYALQASKICQTKHTVIPCTANCIRKIISGIGTKIDEPIIDAAFLPLYLLSKKASEQVKVILSGDGADELFAGYQRYHQELLFEKIRDILKFFPYFLPALNNIFENKFQRILTPISDHYSSQKIWTNNMIKGLLVNKDDFKFQTRLKDKTKDSLPYMQKTDLKGFLAEQLLMKTDKATMLHSLEGRLPYLDPKIINFSFNLPSNLKSSKLNGKYLLKKVAEKYFPKEFVYRKKHGFSVPLNSWFKNELKDIVWDSYKDTKHLSIKINSKYYKQIIKQHVNGEKDWADQIWGIVVLTKFLRENKFSKT